MIKLMLQNISTKKRSRLCIADGYKNLEQEAENMTTLSLIKSKVMYLFILLKSTVSSAEKYSVFTLMLQPITNGAKINT